MSVSCGDTFLLPPTASSDPHLWIVLTDPEGNPTPQVVMVNLTSMRPGADTTVVLDRGDHSFIRHETVVYYGDARFADPGALEKGVGAGMATRHDPLNDDLLKRVQDGLLESNETPIRIKRYCHKRF